MNYSVNVLILEKWKEQRTNGDLSEMQIAFVIIRLQNSVPSD